MQKERKDQEKYIKEKESRNIIRKEPLQGRRKGQGLLWVKKSERERNMCVCVHTWVCVQQQVNFVKNIFFILDFNV